MNHWFQNLNDNRKKLFHFRGSFQDKDYRKNFLKYEICSGPNLKLRYGCSEDGPQWTIGLFFFTAYLTSPFLKIPFLNSGREYGFYFHEWAFVWSWHSKRFESSSQDPWWMSQYIHLDDLVLGKPERLEHEICEISDVYFKIGNKEFKMDSIVWEENRTFRRHIPYTLYHRTFYSVKMEIKDPPIYSGKGENFWDCGDDGSYGLSAPWNFERPMWDKRDQSAEKAVRYYVDHVMKSVARYGGSTSERGIRKDLAFEYFGRKPNVDANAVSGREYEQI